MTARDEANEAMQTLDNWGLESYGGLLDAIPADVLARLAIERGALRVTSCTAADGWDGECTCTARDNEWDAPLDRMPVLYRMVNP